MYSTLLLLWAATISSAKLFVNYDEKLEGRPNVYTVVKEEVGRLDIPSKSSNKNNDSKMPLGIDLKPREALEVLLGKRQTCAQGYGYCPSAGGCCISNSLCCSYGYCHTQGSACCPSGPCDQGQTCCGVSHCMPTGDQCCEDESHCPAGNNCYLSSLSNAIVCCTDAKCTAHVDDGKTTYAQTTTTTRTYTTTYYQTYYWTITWYYWYYYWTYSIDIQASVVTSTRSTTQTVFSVTTTDISAASEYFSEKSKTLSLPTPAAATSLESLAGSTSFISTPSSKGPRPSQSSSPGPASEPSITEMPSAPLNPIPSSGRPDDNDSSSSSESRSSSTTTLLRSGGDDDGSPPKSGGSGSSGAKPLWAGSDWKSLWVLALGVGTGALAAIL
ncbi:carbohydrate-binding module family 18 protein [Trichoderma austrokoningii]